MTASPTANSTAHLQADEIARRFAVKREIEQRQIAELPPATGLGLPNLLRTVAATCLRGTRVAK